MASQKSGYENSITPEENLFNPRFGEIWHYRDLLMLFVRRDFVAKYKQTILGPLWFFIQPLFQTAVLAIVFGGMAALPTDGVPPVLFYLAGITAWNYFSNCLRTTSNTFTANAALFGKVYFPRVIIPISVVVSNLIQFGVGMLLFVTCYAFFILKGYALSPNYTLLLIPALVMMMGFMGLGLGMLISAMTIRYRDLQYLVEFGVQLLMYTTPVILPLSTVQSGFKIVMLGNPMTGIIETFKYAFLSTGVFSWGMLAYSASFTGLVFLLGLLLFNKTEKNFMDTV